MKTTVILNTFIHTTMGDLNEWKFRNTSKSLKTCIYHLWKFPYIHHLREELKVPKILSSPSEDPTGGLYGNSYLLWLRLLSLID